MAPLDTVVGTVPPLGSGEASGWQWATSEVYAVISLRTGPLTHVQQPVHNPHSSCAPPGIPPTALTRCPR